MAEYTRVRLLFLDVFDLYFEAACVLLEDLNYIPCFELFWTELTVSLVSVSIFCVVSFERKLSFM